MNRTCMIIQQQQLLYSEQEQEPLNIERRHTDGYTNCEICKANTTEGIEHFLLDCKALTSTRQNIIGLQIPYKENRETHIAGFLLFNIKINQNIIIRNRDDLQKLWHIQELNNVTKNANITTNNFIESL